MNNAHVSTTIQNQVRHKDDNEEKSTVLTNYIFVCSENLRVYRRLFALVLIDTAEKISILILGLFCLFVVFFRFPSYSRDCVYSITIEKRR
jgi:hypothetical protein